MNEKFVEYAKSLELTSAGIGELERLLKISERLLPAGEVEEIFISDIVDRQGQRSFISLFMFAGGYLLEAKKFETQADVEITYLVNSVDYLRVSMEEYQPGENATLSSRLSVQGYLNAEWDLDLKASGENCSKLWNIATDRLIPNWKTSPLGGD